MGPRHTTRWLAGAAGSLAWLGCNALLGVTDGVITQGGTDATLESGDAPVADGDAANADAGDASAGDASIVDVDAAVPTVAPSSLAVGYAHACVLVEAGVYCWGDDTYQGLGADAACEGGCAVPQRVEGLDGRGQIIGVAAGSRHSCALFADGTAYCWGLNDHGQLGIGRQTPTDRGSVVTSGTKLVTLALGGTHSCAATMDGKALCWGSAYNGQLGLGDTQSYDTPQTVPGLAGVVDVGVGYAFSCAMLSDGSVQCWGANSLDELATDAGMACDDAGDICSPTPVTGLEGMAIALSVQGNHACALIANHHVNCWGNNGNGDEGNGQYISTSHATQVIRSGGAPLQDVGRVTAGEPFACAEVGDGGLACWGLGDQGELGLGLATTPFAAPAPGLASVAHPVLGFEFGCGTRTDGTVVCWGVNDSRQVGPGCDAGSGCVPSLVPLP